MPNEPLTINEVRIKSAFRIPALLLNHAAFADNASIVECKKLQKSTVVMRFKFFILQACIARNS